MESKKVLVIGGAGYVGGILIPKLLAKGHEVRVFDLYMYGENVFTSHKFNNSLVEIKADLRNPSALRRALEGVDTVIHLACISNDPSFDLDPRLGKSINYDSLGILLDLMKRHRVKRFIFVSSAAVYGVQSAAQFMREDSAPNPQTDYAKYKLLAEKYIRENADDLEFVIIRSATVCGYSPRMRLDVLVNLFTAQAFNNRLIAVYSGDNVRPHIHIQDISDLYVQLVEAAKELVAGRVFNAGGANLTIRGLAELVKEQVGKDVMIKETVSPDIRSCKLDPSLITKTLGFKVRYSVNQAIEEVREALTGGKIVDPLNNPIYYNLKTVQLVNLK